VIYRRKGTKNFLKRVQEVCKKNRKKVRKCKKKGKISKTNQIKKSWCNGVIFSVLLSFSFRFFPFLESWYFSLLQNYKFSL